MIGAYEMRALAPTVNIATRLRLATCAAAISGRMPGRGRGAPLNLFWSPGNTARVGILPDGLEAPARRQGADAGRVAWNPQRIGAEIRRCCQCTASTSWCWCRTPHRGRCAPSTGVRDGRGSRRPSRSCEQAVAAGRRRGLYSRSIAGGRVLPSLDQPPPVADEEAALGWRRSSDRGARKW